MRIGKRVRNNKCPRNRINNVGYSLVELIVVIAIMAIMVGVISLGLGMMFTRDANYAAVRIDDMLTEARTVSMSREGDFSFVLHIDPDPKEHYVEIRKSGETDPYKKVLLDKSVLITVTGDNVPTSGDIAIIFDKANGCMKTIDNPGKADPQKASGVYTFTLTSTKNTSKTKTVTLVATTGRHYTEK